ncbi:hemolysin family protein [Anaerobacillus isosaccharinicus]|uniref:Hemolysin family protein n=1 Tax=Anaerobacillus isosaccharinicus TaxID=1532552 RepID=A0A7S7L5F6_9BACI|nr:hemolysin family protein [Anaerobacillus isosaccharinicus]MBA5587015.1 HlyC/CorC family transporter [Anaerobacillus isosaccharinicus]QOY34784.1 HlyC/CorC family transporter [Anaerobacillus isosaccharinicus]
MENFPFFIMVLLIILLFLSAFFSSAETAFSSANRIRLKNYVDENRKGSKNALMVTENFDKGLSTILVGNNVVNIGAATISAKLATDLFGAGTGMIINTVVMTTLVLIFGEILPKSYAKENAESFALKISGILAFLMRVLAPVTIIFISLKKAISKMMTAKEYTPSVTEEELKVMINISEEEGIIDKKERELVHSALNFDDIVVGEILTPRIDMIAVEVDDPKDEILEMFLQERYSRVPVYKEHIDNIIGILSEREFLSHLVQNKTFSVKDLLRKPMFVVESLKISSLLPELQKNKTHMAIVIDEHGGTEGLITMEDILEEIVGEIWDEHDEKVSIMNQLDENTYQFSADVPLTDFCQLLAVPIPDSSYHSLGGWIVEKIEKIPNVGEEILYHHLTIIVHEMDGRRIRQFIVKKNELAMDEDL